MNSNKIDTVYIQICLEFILQNPKNVNGHFYEFYIYGGS